MNVIVLLLWKSKKKGEKSIYLINIHERISCVRRRTPWHAGISAASIGALFWTKYGVDTCAAVIKIKQCVFRYGFIFRHEHVLETTAKLILGFTLCIVVLNL